MTTRRQIRGLFRPLLERNHDLTLLDNVDRVSIVVVRPVRHLLRFILIDRTQEANRFRPRWALIELFDRMRFLGLEVGKLIYRRPGQAWDWRDSSMEEELVEVVERDALPELRAISSLNDYLEFLTKWEKAELHYRWGTRPLIGIAFGDFDRARDLLGAEACAPYRRAMNERSAGLAERLLEQGDRLSRGDRCELVRMLHEWEAFSVVTLNLGSVWEPTPFPLELEAAGA